jgi:glyoxylase-like metal-dependent hydrolase (beta-lactamase superfamily II)
VVVGRCQLNFKDLTIAQAIEIFLQPIQHLMLSVSYFTFNPFSENTYLITNEKNDCWIVDPGMYGAAEVKELTSFIAKNNLTPKSIINTHAHLDHIFGVNALKGEYDIQFGLHAQEKPVLEMGTATAAMFGFDFTDIPMVDFYISEREPLLLGDDALDVRFTPGHSPGSISYYYKPGNWVIGGDVLFSGSIGRTDLPGGDFDTLITSIKTQLLTLPDETTVYSGHGGATKIGHEKKYNPYLV